MILLLFPGAVAKQEKCTQIPRTQQKVENKDLRHKVAMNTIDIPRPTLFNQVRLWASDCCWMELTGLSGCAAGTAVPSCCIFPVLRWFCWAQSKSMLCCSLLWRHTLSSDTHWSSCSWSYKYIVKLLKTPHASENGT